MKKKAMELKGNLERKETARCNKQRTRIPASRVEFRTLRAEVNPLTVEDVDRNRGGVVVVVTQEFRALSTKRLSRGKFGGRRRGIITSA